MSEVAKVMMGTQSKTWDGTNGMPRTITFSVTEDCNLACKYCYMTGKNHSKKMSFETAKKSVDYILTHREIFKEKSIVWEFIGGEPFLEMELIDKISDYIKQQMFLLDHPWFNSYRFSFSSNGLLYNTPAVQNYIKCNHHHLSIGLSVDGNKIKHDLQRVRVDGTGSYDDVVKNVPLWIEQFPNAATKATFAHDDLPYLKDSIISLWNIGIKDVSANVVFEDVWQDGDDEIMEQQLKELADYVLEHEKWKDCSVRFFDPAIGKPLLPEDRYMNYCGGGNAMMAVDCDGNFAPCVRFLNVSLNNKPPIIIGNAEDGINTDKIRPFLGLNLEVQSPSECINCDVASGCAWCQGCNYDVADTDTIYKRATYICKMHKATVRGNKYFWDKFEKVTGIKSKRKDYQDIKKEEKYLQFITSDNVISHCGYGSMSEVRESMSLEIYQRGLEFCDKNFFNPVMLGTLPELFDGKNYIVIDEAGKENNTISIYDNTDGEKDSALMGNLLLKKNNIEHLLEILKSLYHHKNRINIEIVDIKDWTESTLKQYESELDKVVEYLESEFLDGRVHELNIINDLWNTTSMGNCDAGITTFSLAPNGKIYICPAFYFHNPEDSVGNLEDGIETKNKRLLELSSAPICGQCDVYNCNRCRFLNKQMTNEYNTPSKMQCLISHVQRKASMKLQTRLSEKCKISFVNRLEEIDYCDPLDKIIQRKAGNGYGE